MFIWSGEFRGSKAQGKERLEWMWGWGLHFYPTSNRYPGPIQKQGGVSFLESQGGLHLSTGISKVSSPGPRQTPNFSLILRSHFIWNPTNPLQPSLTGSFLSVSYSGNRGAWIRKQKWERPVLHRIPAPDGSVCVCDLGKPVFLRQLVICHDWTLRTTWFIKLLHLEWRACFL